MKPYIEFWHKGHKTHTELLAGWDASKRVNDRYRKSWLKMRQRHWQQYDRGVTPVIFVCYNSTQSNGKMVRNYKGQGTWLPKPVSLGVHKPWNSVLWRGKGLPQVKGLTTWKATKCAGL